jgi:hypothetical protein
MTGNQVIIIFSGRFILKTNSIKKLLVLYIFFAVCGIIFSQNITSDRRTTWSTHFFQIETDTTINILDYGADNSGVTNCLPAYSQILLDFPSEAVRIYFPPGTYLFTAPVNLRSNMILAGAGSDSTLFKFNGSGVNNFIQVYGSASAAPVGLASHYAKDDFFVTATDASGLQPGDFIKIIEDDAGRITSAWASNLIGQLVEIDTIVGNDIYFTDPLRLSFDSINNPRFIKVNMKTRVGIECLAIERMDATVAQTKNIDFSWAAYCYVNGVKSNKTNFGHVVMSNSYNVHVTNSYFTNSHGYGGGGQGYGVVLQLTSGNCLVQNNIFEHLRHSMLLQACVNGNMLAYNYSRDPYWDSFPSNASGDLVLHGNYVFMNLLEGNIVQNIVMDDSHGLNGPFNTFYRNRAELFGIVMNNASDNQNFVGNEITNLLIGFYTLVGSGHYEYGNNDGGTTVPAGTSLVQDTTLFITNQNPYNGLIGALPFIGYPNLMNTFKNQAQLNFEAGVLANCGQEFIDTTTHDTNTVGNEGWPSNPWTLYPNPTSQILYVTGIEAQVEYEVYNSQGVLCLQGIYAQGLNIEGLAPGLYFLRINSRHHRFIKE